MTRQRWTHDEDALLLRLYPSTRTHTLAAALRRPIRAVYARATHLGLRKDAGYLASAASGRLSGQRGVPNRFRAGHLPHNKGLRRPGWTRGRMRDTQFVAGVPPHNTVPIGTERVRMGYLFVKTRDDLRPARKCWISKHQHLYERAHGPIPAGHIVRFRDNNRAHFALHNLECVSRAEHAATKGLHSLPPEIVKIHQLRGAILRQINQRQPPQPKPRIGRPPIHSPHREAVAQ